jgi:sugar transferase EpsL
MPLFPLGVPASKRLFDLGLTIPGLILLSPFIGILSLFIALKMGRPVLFKQARLGYREKPFFVRKFRTMTDERDSLEHLLPDAERLTPLGKVLRSTSIDELPELLNVLKGEMSLVGPRPLFLHYKERYNTEQMRRHHVLPGITGWAQVNGRNALSWSEKFRLDVWYVDHRTFWLDIKILFLTFWKVISREGISQPGHATMEEFMGNEDAGPHA